VNRMSWDKLLSSKRLFKDAENCEGRTPFDRDAQRIIFSSSFRRLSKKTQVHPLVANDNVHTRLTHSLEVAQVGKTLGTALAERLKKHRPDEFPKHIRKRDVGAIVESACLAHDLGNPPFGHGGEKAMRHWFEENGSAFFGDLDRPHQKDLMFFEGNAQGFRIITQTENHLFKGGLRLTYATLGAFLKYPWSSRIPSTAKFGAFLTEEGLLEEVATELGLIRLQANEPIWCRHPLAYMVEAADDICYAILDLEDAVELKILSYREVKEILCRIFTQKEMHEIESDLVSGEDAFRINLARIRGYVFRKTIVGAVDGFMNAYDDIMSGRYCGKDVFDAIDGKDELKSLISTAKSIAEKEVFNDKKKIEIEIGSYAVFDTLLSEFCAAVVDYFQHQNNPQTVGFKWKSEKIMRMMGNYSPENTAAISQGEYEYLRRAIDYIAGMTDNYAVSVANQLRGAAFSALHRL
jgi:dGTPase